MKRKSWVKDLQGVEELWCNIKRKKRSWMAEDGLRKNTKTCARCIFLLLRYCFIGKVRWLLIYDRLFRNNNFPGFSSRRASHWVSITKLARIILVLRTRAWIYENAEFYGETISGFQFLLPISSTVANLYWMQ